VTVLNVLQLKVKLGEICFLSLIFVREQFKEIAIAELPLGLKPRHVVKFWQTSEKVSWR